MIGYQQIGETCSRLDDLGESGTSFESIAAFYNVNPNDLFQAAEQRALRIAMMMADQDPRKMPRDRKTHVELDDETRANLRWLMAAFMDGFIAGRAVTDPADLVQRFPERGDS